MHLANYSSVDVFILKWQYSCSALSCSLLNLFPFSPACKGSQLFVTYFWAILGALAFLFHVYFSQYFVQYFFFFLLSL